MSSPISKDVRRDAAARVSRRRLLRWGGLSGGLAIAAPALLRSARAQGLQKITVAVATAPIEPNHHYYLYAKSRGYYKDAGLDVDIRSIRGDVNCLRAVVAGDADVGNVGAYPALSAANAGARVKGIGAITPHFDSHIGARKTITSLKELEGKSFAVSGIGDVAQVGPMLCIEQAGGDPSKVQWVTVGSGSVRVQGLIGGAFQATAFNTVYVKRVTSYPDLHILADQGKMLPNFIYTWEVASPGLLAKKDLLSAFWIATARAAQWGQQNPAEAAKISQAFLPDEPKEEISFQLDTYARNKHWLVDGLLPRDYWDFTTAALLRHKLLDKAPSYDDFMVNDFALAARKALQATR
jgi:ABC-type nitrate/sulfonate/bicarbonate transport system substrate-binding protein